MAAQRGPERPRGLTGKIVWAREQTNAAILPLARTAGLVGLVLLGVCLVLLQVPESSRPDALEDEPLAFYTMLALATSSLLGWGCMQLGLARVRRAVGWRTGGYLFVLLPLACATTGLVFGSGDFFRPEDVPGHQVWWPFVRFYPPCVVVGALVAFLFTKTTEGEGAARVARGGWALLSVAPYAALIAVLAFGVEVEWLHDGLEDTLDELGAWALVLQVILAFFVGGGGVA